jgi:RNA recognition motif-containing protein
MDKEAVREAFTQLGLHVTDIHVPNDRETGRPRGFAFITVEDDQGRALAVCEGLVLDQRAVRVEIAEQRPQNGGGGGGNKSRQRPSGSGDGGGHDRDRGHGRRGRDNRDDW